MSNIIKIAWGTLGVAMAVLALKFSAYFATGSVALYSDALESTINVVGAVAALLALQVSARPADDNHPYEHQKAEYLSTVVEGGLVLGTSFVIATLPGWHSAIPAPPRHPWSACCSTAAAAWSTWAGRSSS